MICLKSLLPLYILNEESAAAAEAHKRGLESAGWGKWRIKGGPVVAKTEKGKLVSLKKPEKPDKRTTKKKATKRTVKRVSDKQAPNAGIDAIQQVVKSTGKELVSVIKDIRDWAQRSGPKDTIDGLTIAAIVNTKVNPSRLVANAVPSDIYLHTTPSERKKLLKSFTDYVKNLRTAMKNVDPMSEIKLLASLGSSDAKGALKGIQLLQSKGIKISSVVNGDYNEARNVSLHRAFAKSHKLKSTLFQDNLKLADNQNWKWRRKMLDKDVKTFNDLQTDWQEGSVWKMGSVSKKRIFKQVNQFTRKYGTPSTGISSVYRGVSMSHKEASLFLTNYEIGDTMASPPSGYTSDYRIGMKFAYNNIEADHSIVFNMKGAGKYVKGIHIALNHSRKGIQGDVSYNTPFTLEQEIIVPSTHGQKVTDIETVVVKLTSDDGDLEYNFITNISLVQDSKLSKKKTIYEVKKPMSQDEKIAKSLFIKYMGGSIRAISRQSLALLKKYMGGKVNPRGTND